MNKMLKYFLKLCLVIAKTVAQNFVLKNVDVNNGTSQLFSLALSIFYF